MITADDIELESVRDLIVKESARAIRDARGALAGRLPYCPRFLIRRELLPNLRDQFGLTLKYKYHTRTTYVVTAWEEGEGGAGGAREFWFVSRVDPSAISPICQTGTIRHVIVGNETPISSFCFLSLSFSFTFSPRFRFGTSPARRESRPIS